MTTRPPQLVFFLLLALAIGLALWQHAHLPERVATHFDFHGHANGWLSRDTHTTAQIATLLFMTAIFLGLPALMRRLPKELVNIPRRNYWLAPERAEATHAYIRDTMLLMGCAVLAFFNVLFFLVYRANLTNPPQLNLQSWWAVAALVAVILGLIIRLIVRFLRTPKN